MEGEALPPEIVERDESWRLRRSRTQALGVVWQSVAIGVVLTAAVMLVERVSV